MKKIKIHFLLTVMSYLFFGFGLGAQMWGIKAGLEFWPTIAIYISSQVFFIIMVFTSMQKVKDKLFNNNKIKTMKGNTVLAALGDPSNGGPEPTIVQVKIVDKYRTYRGAAYYLGVEDDGTVHPICPSLIKSVVNWSPGKTTTP